jgi:hypothetical protein
MCVPPPSNFWMPEQNLVYIYNDTWDNLNGVLHKTPPISLSVCMFIPPLSLLGNGSVIIFCAVRVVSKESLWFCLYIPYYLLGNGSVIIFCAVRVVSKKSLWFCLYIPYHLLGNGSVIIFFAVRVVSKESLWFCLYILYHLLGNGSVNTFSS